MPAKSDKQAIAARIALAAKKGKGPKSLLKGASKQMYNSMSQKQLHHFTHTESLEHKLEAIFFGVLDEEVGPPNASIQTQTAANEYIRAWSRSGRTRSGEPTGRTPSETYWKTPIGDILVYKDKKLAIWHLEMPRVDGTYKHIKGSAELIRTEAALAILMAFSKTNKTAKAVNPASVTVA
jgi:hypothetical protein